MITAMSFSSLASPKWFNAAFTACLVSLSSIVSFTWTSEANNRSVRFGFDFAEKATQHTVELAKRMEKGRKGRNMGNVSFSDDAV